MDPAYGSMPSHASANPEIKQLYINGHFCYVFKFGIVTNGLGIIRHISFYNKNFMTSHPDIVVEKKSDSPDEDKYVHDSKLLIPTLKDFFFKHPLINPKTFLAMLLLIQLHSIPYCPHDNLLSMNHEETSKFKGNVTRHKFVCPKIKSLPYRVSHLAKPFSIKSDLLNLYKSIA